MCYNNIKKYIGVFMNIFNEVDKFFTSLTSYLTENLIFEIFAGLFLLTLVLVIISTSHSYEAKLIKAIDMFNTYFMNNPQITEDNLVAFNNRMKSNKVPKQLRKQWQQFVLYREHNASYYMSFENCVSTPIKNSTYKRDVSVLNIVTYILASACLLLNFYRSYTSDVATILQHAFLCPVLMLLINFIVTIFLDLRHNAIVSDLNSNFQYFEVNIDKATQTIPEYVDYEVLFDRNEIKRGIPILYAYLQKRAEDEQKELERARLKNVEHEKFNFDDAGVESSLVLERAMQEAENYIAERKKYLTDIEQINADITQEEISFRDITKEYQRQMQVSKETFEDFKTQLQDVGSSIQANYIKKQQQQELERQRNLERDYDTATDRHKKLLDSLQTELTGVESMIKDARTSLEKAMMSEFSTYSEKVYAEAVKTANARDLKKKEELKAKVQTLSTQLQEKEDELKQAQEKLNSTTNQPTEQTYVEPQTQVQASEQPNLNYSEQSAEEQPYQYDAEPNSQLAEQQDYTGYQADGYAEGESEYPTYAEQEQTSSDEDYNQYYANQGDYVDANDETDAQPEYGYAAEQSTDEQSDDYQYPYSEDVPQDDANASNVFNVVEETPVKKAGRPKKQKVETAPTEKKKAGRPKKAVTEVAPKEKKQRGRPKKEDAKVEQEKPATKKKAGRPAKATSTAKTTETSTGKRGRPKKQTTATEKESSTLVKIGRGRPKKQTNEPAKAKNSAGKRGRPKKVQGVEMTSSNLEDIDEYLKQIDNEIALENAKIEESKRKLEKLSKKK